MKISSSLAVKSRTHLNEHLGICNVDHDGTIVNLTRDPPGQKSVYIYPGDQEDERYRMTTFLKFPKNVLVDVSSLARNGFVYTGFRDRVKCFSCGVIVEQWNANDDPSAKKWHFLNCEFYTGVQQSNKPAGNRLRHLLHQTTSVPHSSNDHGREAVSTSSSSPTTSHQQLTQTHQRNHENASQLNANVVIVNNHASQSSNLTSSGRNSQTPRMGANQIFACSNPVNPHMRSLESRLSTYRSGWQASRVRATPKQLAETGLYFLGERDRLKCWYCNGGLQNWEFDDDPWFEHAKWFPTCDFLLQMKGPDYVHDVARRFPNLRRPVIRTTVRRQVLSGLNMNDSERSGLSLSRPTSQNRPSGAALKVIDPRKELKLLKRRTDDEMMKSYELVTAAENMGFRRAQVKAAFMRKLQSGNKESFRGFEDLVDFIVSFCEDVPSDDEENAEFMTSPSPSRSSSSLTATEEVRRLEKEKRCKICNERDVEVVFLPCGHLVSCVRCSQNTSRCPLCKEFISQKVRTYAS